MPTIAERIPPDFSPAFLSCFLGGFAPLREALFSV
jgi:hypothetical protein